jgi:hypothetical protein
MLQHKYVLYVRTTCGGSKAQHGPLFFQSVMTKIASKFLRYFNGPVRCIYKVMFKI